jgi:hypothetical protein
METKEKIKETLLGDDSLLFYKIMNYPIPIEKDFFSLEKKSNINSNQQPKTNNIFSRTQQTKLFKNYTSYINKF